jgi:two-component sensor histidine kinase
VSFSTVFLREENRPVRVTNSQDKPEVPAVVVAKWQRLVDLLSEIFDVPASLVMKMTDREMSVLLSSQNPENPYSPGDSDSLGHGLYCETVIGHRAPLEVPDALEQDAWKDNPDVKLNMTSYLGFPLLWPDGSVFGTICCLDSRRRKYSETFKKLMRTFKEVIELDLHQILEMHDLQARNTDKERIIREIHHRLKNNFNSILAYIQIKREIKDVTVDRVFGEVENRIRAISMLHDRITSEEDVGPDSRTYVIDLARSAVAALSLESVDLDLHIDSVDLGSTTLEVGAVLVELISNSVKYAFTETRSPKMSIELTCANGECRLRYADNGPGIPEDYQPGIGMILVDALAKKYHGSLTIEGEKRNSVVITFRLSGQPSSDAT